ncbi:MAG: coproporphyrinogen dehydrogenase HemZ, partial [Clostridia bacterium]|nr:coproporphyrinogen dehydrogenase HemZ [Clostridia bacterium]
RASRLHEHMDKYELPSVATVEKMVKMGFEASRRMGMKPYYMYRQKYMTGNLENVGYSNDDAICIYNIDMMEDSMSIIAHGAGAMNKRVFREGGRIERIPNPKDIDTYIEKLSYTQREREALFSLE